MAADYDQLVFDQFVSRSYDVCESRLAVFQFQLTEVNAKQIKIICYSIDTNSNEALKKSRTSAFPDLYYDVVKGGVGWGGVLKLYRTKNKRNKTRAACVVKEPETDFSIEKNYVLYCHLVIFGLILALFLRSQSYFFCHCTHITLIWCRMMVKNSLESYGQFFRKSKKSKNSHFSVLFCNFDFVSEIPVKKY